jgi:hypothetical protein
MKLPPEILIIPFYFNPATAGVTNRALLGAFEYRYAADGFSIGPVSIDPSSHWSTRPAPTSRVGRLP